MVRNVIHVVSHMPEGKEVDIKALEALAGLLPILRSEHFDAGRWVDAGTNEAGTRHLPHVLYSEDVRTAVGTLWNNGGVSKDFDWPNWIGTCEAKALLTVEDALPVASADQLRKLLTTIIRRDRFVEGALLDAFTSGLMRRIALRASALLAEVASGDRSSAGL